MGDAIKFVTRLTVAILACLAVVEAATEFGLIDTFFGLPEAQQTALWTALFACLAYQLVHDLTRRRVYTSIPGTAIAMAPRAVMSHKGAAAATRSNENIQEESETLTEQNKRIRYHEAGHAAVALHLGFKVGLVSTIAQGSSGGRVLLESHPAGNRANAALWDKAIMALAGSAAETHFLGEASASGLVMDLKEVQLICSALASAKHKVDGQAWTAGELMTKAQERADRYVREYSGHVESIAEHLIEHPEITGKQAADIFDAIEGERQVA